MRFTCHFLNPKTDERKTIVATLNTAECKSIESLRRHKGNETADVTAEAYALRKAYSEVPEGFLHSEPPKQVHLS
ncbi:hypothetical protein M2171_004941 [Bradyrhizobium japonicum USDA 38]|uniref:hypothetical protein n=1 Tax=Bradyrhizobium japonicum TaxID=375 RepID=UPI0003FCEE36|nr:hypothetical protein [Bradyrhizobium japonicum]MCS3895808.1 hypothetical protein [Bradyrhizobium japonicum USDA 38]MCS3948323.1 hypothetical protein [Bradyrhizobium japonicum]